MTETVIYVRTTKKRKRELGRYIQATGANQQWSVNKAIDEFLEREKANGNY